RRKNMEGNRPVIIGVGGGRGSGKTSVTRAIWERCGEEKIFVIEQDYCYKDQSHLTLQERLEKKYDHPLVFDSELIVEHVKPLLNNKPIEKPVYDYKLHTRSQEVIHVEPKQVIIVEGILILEHLPLVDLMDIKVFVDTDADVRIIRRLLRDIKERGRSLDSVIQQYIESVRPMHLQFVEPAKRYADIIIPEGGENHVAIDLLATKVKHILDDVQS